MQFNNGKQTLELCENCERWVGALPPYATESDHSFRGGVELWHSHGECLTDEVEWSY